MTRLRPLPDGKGVEVAQVINLDPAGMIPNIVKKKLAKA